MDAVRRSAHLYYQPDTLYGYGIPDFDKAYSLLKKWPLPVNSPAELSIFPNPFRDHIVIDFYSFISEPFTIEAYGTWGRKNYSASVPAINNTYVMIDGLEGLPRGTVIFKIIFATKTITYKCVKI